MRRTVAVVASLVTAFAAAACEVTVEDTTGSDGDTHGTIIQLEGAALTEELATSPRHASPGGFVRVGAIWEGDHPGAFEIATSVDGMTWSPWQPLEIGHVELEATGGFVGQRGVSGPPARWWRVRGIGGRTATWLRLELLPSLLTDAIEDGEESGGTGALYALDVGGATVHPRAEWGARATRCTSAIASPYRVTIHHSETPTSDGLSPEARLRNIQSYHMDVNGWCDVGYHYLQSRDGRLWEGRPANLHGAHAGGSNNTGNLGVAVIGTHDATPITAAQVTSLGALVGGLSDQHGIQLDRAHVKAHRELKDTSCPGDALFAQLGAILAEAGSAPPPPPPPPPPVTGTVKGVLYAGGDTSARIAGATVNLGTRSVTTGASGLFVFEGVAAGEITISATAAGHQPRSITRFSTGAETWASFSLSAAGANTGTSILQGVVYQGADSSNRIAGASVRVSTGATAVADGNGFYRLTGLAPGPVTITVSAAGFATASIQRTLVDGQTEWGSARLEANTQPPQTGWWRPAPGTSWQWQLSGTLNTSYPVAMYDVDLFITSQAQIDALRASGRKVVCYFSAGSYEPGRPDSGQFPAAAIGRVMDGWPDEKWLDVRAAGVRSIMVARLDVARQKRCDGVEPDNVDGYTNATGFPLTGADQLDYNRFLAREAHARGLSIGLKNDLDQIAVLVGDFDWALNEQCEQYSECGMLAPFIAAGKAVFQVEYGGASRAQQICPAANARNHDALVKSLDLGPERIACR